MTRQRSHGFVALRTASVLIAALQTVALARILGPAQAGVILGAMSITQLLLAWLPMGTEQLYLKGEITLEAFARYCRTLAATSLMVALGGAVAVPFTESNVRLCIALFGVHIALECVRLPYIYEPQRALNFLRRGLREFGVKLVIVSVTVVAAAVTDSPVWVATLLPITSAALYLWARPPFERPLFASARRSFTHGLAFALSASLYTITFQIDTAMLTVLRSAREVGLYRAAYALFSFALVLPIVINTEIMRTHLYVDPKAAVGKWLALSMLYGLLIAAVLYGAGEQVIGQAFGGEFSPSYEAVRILALAVPLYCLASWLANRLVGLGFTKPVVIVQVIGVLTAIGLNALLIPRSGIQGAAWATAGTEMVLVLLYTGLTRRARSTALPNVFPDSSGAAKHQ